MEWMNRGARQNQPAGQPVGQGAPGASNASPVSNNKSSKQGFGGMKFVNVLVLVLVAIVLFGLIILMVRGNGSSGVSAENKYVDTSKMQAVFLNGGQVYFGKISALNEKYMKVGDIYYLRVNQQVQPNQQSANTSAAQNDISLVKLGCELHGPQDEMLINRDQIIFWENLKDDGQVAKAVAEYKKQNPNGQKCETAASSSSSAPASTTPASNTKKP